VACNKSIVPLPQNLATRIVTDITALGQRTWDQLDHADNPFVSYAFLAALESSGSVCAATGWQPHHLAVYENDVLLAFAPSYLKSHSHGEFVFDWAWADAYHRHNRAYYPKLLTAVPYSPVPGPRLLVRRNDPMGPELRRRLVHLALAECDRLNLSSWHCNFVLEEDAATLQQEPLLARNDWQFHWTNRGYGNFDEFLAQLRSKKRKNIRRDRRLVQDAGIRFEYRTGVELNQRELEFVCACYQATFLEHGNHPALTNSFFARLVRDLAQDVLVVLALRGNEAIAMSLCMVGGGRLYGRYWGCMESVPGLHFETCYYQGIDYCITHGIDVFEPGAQGEHKISRGFIPVATRSFHHVQDPVFRRAIAEFLHKEHEWMEQYRQHLEDLEPFRAPVAL